MAGLRTALPSCAHEVLSPMRTAPRAPDLNLGRRTLESLAWSVLSTPLVAVVSLMVVPLYLRDLSQAELGGVLLAQQLAGIGLALLPSTNEVLLQRLSAAYGVGDRHRMRQVFATGLAGVAVQALLLLILAAGAHLARSLFGQSGEATLAVMAAFLGAIALQKLAESGSATLAALQRPSVIGIIGTSANIAGPFVSVLLIRSGLGRYGIPASTALMSLLSAGAYFAAIRTCAPWLSASPLAATRTFFRDEFWPQVRARWMAALPTALGPNSDRVVVGAIGGSKALVAGFTLTGRLPDLVSTVLPYVALAAVPALAYLSDAKKMETQRATGDLLCLTTGLAAGAALATGIVLPFFLVLWVPSLDALPKSAQWAFALAVVPRGIGGTVTTILSAIGRNHLLPLINWGQLIGTLTLALGGGLFFGVPGVAVGLCAGGWLFLLPLSCWALVREGLLDTRGIWRLLRVAMFCAAAGGAAAALVLRGVTPASVGWGQLSLSVGSSVLASLLAVFIADPAASGRRVMQLVRR